MVFEHPKDREYMKMLDRAKKVKGMVGRSDIELTTNSP